MEPTRTPLIQGITFAPHVEIGEMHTLETGGSETAWGMRFGVIFGTGVGRFKRWLGLGDRLQIPAHFVLHFKHGTESPLSLIGAESGVRYNLNHWANFNATAQVGVSGDGRFALAPVASMGFFYDFIGVQYNPLFAFSRDDAAFLGHSISLYVNPAAWFVDCLVRP